MASSDRRVKELCRGLKPLFGARAEQLYSAYLAEDDDGKALIEKYLEVLSAKHLSAGLDAPEAQLLPPGPQQAGGPYALGDISYAGKSMGEFGLKEKEWIQHVGVFGRTGAGKTNLGFLMLEQLVKAGKPVLVFDWKRNYRDLLSKPLFKNARVYTIGRPTSPFTFNPLIPPPGTNPKTWLKKLNEVIAHAYMLGNGVLYLLQQSLDQVYQDAGVYDGTVSRWPTFQDLLAKARQINARGREAGWLSSTLRALASLCFGEMGDLVNQPGPTRPEDLMNEVAILELDALTQQDKVFFVSALLLYIHHLRMAEAERETFKHAILIEEAHHILSGERRSLVGGQSVMEITFREIREFGESLILLDQHPSQISLPALGNTYCTICLNLKHSKDVSAMAQCMLLEGAEKDILGSLEVGQAVVKLQGRVPKPFLIRMPEFEITKGTVTDEMVRVRMQPHLATRTTCYAQPWTVTNAIEKPRPAGAVPPSAPTQPEDDLALRFLMDVQDHPDSGIAARYKRLGISVRQGQRIKTHLAAEGLIKETAIRTSTGRLLEIRLTDRGRQLLLDGRA